MMASPDAWSSLRGRTPARIALGRTGGSLPTAELMAFAQAHAEARDAVHAELDVERLLADLATLELQPVVLKSQARDRVEYLQRPELGRSLHPDRAAVLGVPASGGGGVGGRGVNAEFRADVALILADGLSAPALQQNAVPLLAALLPLLQRSGVSLAPLTIVRHARVAIEDEIGQLLGAKLAVIVLGERPGLTAPASLGAYLVYRPQLGSTDANRNCVSNIHPAGLAPARAAETLHYLITESLQRQLSGVHLKDTRPGLSAGS